MLGQRIDKYDVLSKIGEGGMATVYLGRHVTLDRKVAIKVLHPHLSASEKNRRRFAREARAIEHLQHDNILRIFDYSGRETDQSYIVTEFVDGVTLRELLEREGLVPSEVAMLIARELAKALRYAHDSGVVHRDLKPENIMIRKDGVVKLMDFGIARFLDESNITMTGALVGSPAYMSPEQVLEKNVGPHSDLFSLGIVLFHLVTGRLPFSGTNPSVILRHIIDGSRPGVLEVQPTASAQMAEIIDRLLEPDPGGRFESAGRLLEVLDDLERDSGLHTEPEIWTLKAFVDDAAAYRQRLGGHLETFLMSSGRDALQAGNHSQARAVFNRLLALHPEHTEVLTLLSDMPVWGPESQSRKVAMAIGGLALLLTVIFSAWWFLAQAPAPQNETVPPPAPVAAAPLVIPVEEPPTPIADLVEPMEEVPVVAVVTQPDLVQSASPPSVGPPDPVSPEDSPPPVEGENTESTLATLHVRLAPEQRAWADIYLDGHRLGRAPVTHQLEPGTHTLKVTNDYALEYVRTFTVGAGETRDFEGIRLEKRPIEVLVATDMPTDCTMWVGQRNLGTVESVGGAYSFREPSSIGQVHFQCPDGSEFGPFSIRMPRPGDSVTLPPVP